MNVSAIIVTRGNVDLAPVLDSLPDEWEKLVWDNGEKACYREPPPNRYWNAGDFSVYGRYAAIEYASYDLIYVQDDDVIVSDPQEIVQEWRYEWAHRCWECNSVSTYADHGLVANMPPEFRHDGYTDSCLVGFGACFHRDLPRKAFERAVIPAQPGDTDPDGVDLTRLVSPSFHRTCDVVFTTLSPRVLVDVPVTHREFASDPDRMWKQPGHVAERTRMLELARKVRDG